MRTRRLLASSLAVAGLVLGILTAPLSAPASAAGPLDRIWTLFDGRQTAGHYGIYHQDGPAGSRTYIPNTNLAYVYYLDLAASGDGTRIIYVRLTGLVGDVRQEIVVRDTGTRQVRVLTSRLASSGIYLDTPSLSPDGTRAVWDEYIDSTSTFTVRRAYVGSGGTIRTATGLGPYTFLSNNLLLVQDAAGHPFTMPFTGGEPKPVGGLPVNAFRARVSPDGTHLTYGLITKDTYPLRSKLQVAPLQVLDGIASVGTPTTLDSSLYNRGPSFSVDGSRVYWIKTNGDKNAPGDIWSAPADASAPASALAVTTAPERDVVVTKNPTNDTALPGAVTTPAFDLLGTAANVRWTLPGDADLSGAFVSRFKGSQVEKSWYFPAPVRGFKDSGLALGATYKYEVHALDRSSRLGPGSFRQLTALGALGATVPDPTSTSSVAAPFPVQVRGTAPSTATWTVNYQADGGPWQQWIAGTDSGGTHTFGGPGSTGVAPTTSTPGSTYRFGTRIADSFGNATPWAITGQAVVPVDQTAATFSGGGNVYTSAAYLGSYRKLWHATDTARITLTGNRLQIVGSTCGTCGGFDVFDNGHWIASVDTYGSVTRLRQVLFTKSYASSGTHGFTIKPRATGGRPDVMLDGFAMRR